MISAEIHHSILRATPAAAGFGNVAVSSTVLFAGHAECPNCRAFVRAITRLASRSMIGELVEGWCSVCSTSTYFLTTA